MDQRIFFQRRDVFPVSKKIISMETNPQNTFFCVIYQKNIVSIFYTEDFKLKIQIDDFKVLSNGTTILAKFSPNGEFLVLSPQKSSEILVIELKTQHKTKIVDEFLDLFYLDFLPFKNLFTIVKSFFSLEVMETTTKIHHLPVSTQKVIVHSSIKKLYILSHFSSIHIYDTESMNVNKIVKMVNFKDDFSRESFLMKNGNLFVFDSIHQCLLDEDCNVLREKSSKFEDSKYLHFVESDCFIISILKNGMLIV
jgi:hypothetical protein